MSADTPVQTPTEEPEVEEEEEEEEEEATVLVEGKWTTAAPPDLDQCMLTEWWLNWFVPPARWNPLVAESIPGGKFYYNFLTALNTTHATRRALEREHRVVSRSSRMSRSSRSSRLYERDVVFQI